MGIEEVTGWRLVISDNDHMAMNRIFLFCQKKFYFVNSISPIQKVQLSSIGCCS